MRAFWLLGALVLMAGCGQAHPNRPPGVDGGDDEHDGAPSDRTLVSIAVAPPSLVLAVGEAQALTVTGTYDDQSSAPISDGITWESSAEATATVAAGVATGVAAGSATITARVGSLSATSAVTVTSAEDVLAVFIDDYQQGAGYLPFGGSVGSPTVDSSEHHGGTASLRVDVPVAGYTGGGVRAATPVDLSRFGALSFWVKASRPATLNVVGLGNDGAVTTYFAERTAIPVTGTWVRHVVPIPLAAKLTAESGLFHFAEGAEDTAYSIWFDDIRFEALPADVAATRSPAIATEAASKLVGDSFLINGASVTWTLDGAPRTLAIGRRYLTFASSEPTVATVDEDGEVSALAVGSTMITARLGDAAALGMLSVTVAESTEPTGPPTVPTSDPASVIALFSGAYTPVVVDTWLTPWSNATLTEAEITGDAVKKYSNLVFAGVEFYTPQAVDATTMTHFHLDVWTPNATVLRVKLVDFGADGAYGGNDDTEHEVTIDAASTPPLVTGAWVSLDLPLADFSHLAARAHLAQLIIGSSTSTVYVDNVYFHR